MDESTYQLHVKSIRVETGEIIAADSIDVKENERRLRYFIPPDVAEKSSFFSAGARAGLSVNINSLSSDITGEADNPHAGFEPAIFGAFHFTDWLAVQAEVVFSPNKVFYSGDDPGFGGYTASFESGSLRIPLLVSFTYNDPEKLKKFTIGGFAGIGFNIPLGAMKLKSSILDESSYRFSMPVSYIAGFKPGLRLGSGLLLADIRFSGDIAKTVVHDTSGTLALYTRNALSFSVGYEYWIK